MPLKLSLWVPSKAPPQSFVQIKRNPEPSSHVSAIVLPKPLAYAADNKNVFLKIRERHKKDSLYLSGKLCFSRAFDSRQEKAQLMAKTDSSKAVGRELVWLLCFWFVVLSQVCNDI